MTLGHLLVWLLWIGIGLSCLMLASWAAWNIQERYIERQRKEHHHDDF